MRNLLLFLILFSLIAPRCLFGQSFAPPGAVWRYLFKPFTSEPPEEVIEVRAMQDTIIQGKTCRWLELTQKPFYLFTQPGIAVYEEGSKVFFVEDTSFYLLYDFALSEGDSYISRLPIAFDTSNQGPIQDVIGLISVDSVKTLIVDGQMRNLQYTSSQIFGFGGVVLEGVGGLNWLFPRVGYPSSDFSEILGIICYKDDGIGYGDTTLCLTSSIKKVLREDKSTPFPNPASESLSIYFEEEKTGSISIADMTGKVWLTGFKAAGQATFEASIRHLPAGVYIVSFQSEAGYHAARKLIVQH